MISTCFNNDLERLHDRIAGCAGRAPAASLAPHHRQTTQATVTVVNLDGATTNVALEA